MSKIDELILMHFYRNLNTVFNAVIAVSFGKKINKVVTKIGRFCATVSTEKKKSVIRHEGDEK